MAKKKLVFQMVFSCFVSTIFCQNEIKSLVFSPTDCEGDQFLDISRLECQQCPTNTVQAPSGYGCICAPTYRKIEDYGGIGIMCEACEDGKVMSPDGWSCIPCNQQDQCATCPSPLQYFYYRTIAGVPILTNDAVGCQQCRGDTWASPEGDRCVPCNPTINNKTCQCTTGTLTGGICFKSGDENLEADNEELYQINFENGVLVNSWYFHEQLRAAKAMCILKNLTACQLLGNLCTLLHYKEAPGGTSNACSLYLKLASDRGSQVQWPNLMPWLYYINEAQTILTRILDIPTSFSFSSDSEYNELKIFAAQYLLNGSFIGLRPVQGGLLQLCSTQRWILDSAYVFGRKYRQRCQIPIQEFWNKYDVILMDLWMQIPDGNGGKNYYPIPVLNTHYRVDPYDNSQDNPSLWKLTRRFFLVDNEIGKTTPENLAQVVRYAKSLTLNIELRTSKNGHIFPPYLRVEYGEATFSEYNDNKKVHVQFEINYSMNTERHEKDWEITMGVLCSIGALWAGLQTYTWARRAGKLVVDPAAVLKLLLILAGTLADVFLVVMLATSLWILVAYKGQRTVVYMVLAPEQEYSFLVYIGLAAAFKFLAKLHLTVELSLAETFFIDWEKSRGRVIPRMSDNSEGSTVDHAESHPPGPVTIWRTYLVANEWNELQSYRKTSVSFQLFSLLFFLKVLNFEALAVVEPNGRLDPVPDEFLDTRMTRFALAGGLYLLIGFFQWFITEFIIERCIVDHFRSFMDLCSVCNISVMCLTRSQFGYYIHGRSVHGYSDTDMKEMNAMLQQERDNLVGRRGLDPNSDEQCFIVALPTEFRERYETMLQPMRASGTAHSRINTSADPVTARTDHTIQVYENVKHYLSCFIEQRIPGIRYSILKRTFLEALLNIEFADSTNEGHFYKDPSEIAYTDAFLYGHEWTQMTFDLLIFCTTDIIAHNYVLSAVITYLGNCVFNILHKRFSTASLVRTSIVDKRFLI